MRAWEKVTVSLSPPLAKALKEIASEEGVSVSEIARSAIRRWVLEWRLGEFRRARAMVREYAEKRGIRTEEDALRFFFGRER